MTLDDILVEINKANHIVLLTHESPDGDAVGSILAMKFALEGMGKKADVILTKVPRMYNFMPGVDTIKEDSEVEKYDLAISLDCATLKRLVGAKYFEQAKKTIVIDHHGTNTMYGDINFVNPVSPACCEILAAMFYYFEVEMTKEIGICILTGIITDTGGFQYSSVTPETFEFTAELLRKGIRVSDIYKQALKMQSRARFELHKRAADRMEFLEDGKVAFTYITNQEIEELGCEPGEHEGIVVLGRDVEGVEVSVFIREAEEGENLYKVSLRSNDYVNVSDIGMLFGGGGHPRAAGATVQGSREQVKAKILGEIHKVLK